MKESTLHPKLENIVKAGKPKSIKVSDKNVYISKRTINECEKEGGILPLCNKITSYGPATQQHKHSAKCK